MAFKVERNASGAMFRVFVNCRFVELSLQLKREKVKPMFSTHSNVLPKYCVWFPVQLAFVYEFWTKVCPSAAHSYTYQVLCCDGLAKHLSRGARVVFRSCASMSSFKQAVSQQRCCASARGKRGGGGSVPAAVNKTHPDRSSRLALSA